MSGFQGFGLVRKADGTPRIDGDPAKLHPAILNEMTPQERRDLGVWDGAFVIDAEGTKRVKRVGTKYEAVDALVAASQLLDRKKVYRFGQRIDVPVGGTFSKG